MATLIGPFKQIVSLKDLPLKGPIDDQSLTIIENGAVVVADGRIVEMGLMKDFNPSDDHYQHIAEDMVLLPGLVDCHTHLVWGGSRHRDYTLRMAGSTYQEILAAGGGIFDTVTKTQEADHNQLVHDLVKRANRHLKDGITTIEVKTGYGLTAEHELKLLQAIKAARSEVEADLISTCLAAHVCPKDFERTDFLKHVENELLPQVLVKGLAHRVDIFVEDNAFPVDLARPYLKAAKQLGFDLTVHADQFTTGGARLAVEVGAQSADHLEASGEEDIQALAASEVMPVALPGASIGLGMQWAPARRLLDAGAGLAIATDWNPGSAPMGDLLVQTALLGIYEKLSAAELLAGITFRAAAALGLGDRGRLVTGENADMIAFPFGDYREIFYHQGKVKPTMVWKNGARI